MSQRQSRQSKHLQSIQRIFVEHDEKLRMHRSVSPNPSHSSYPSARFAIHRNRSPKPEPKSVPVSSDANGGNIASVGSLFDMKKKASIADLHSIVHSEAQHDQAATASVKVPSQSAIDDLLVQMDDGSKSLRAACTHYDSLQKSLSTVVREQSAYINALLLELQRKNLEIERLKHKLSEKGNHVV